MRKFQMHKQVVATRSRSVMSSPTKWDDAVWSSSKMTDLRQYTKKFIVEFIHLYKSHPTLWQIKNKDYRDKTKKAAAYEILIKKCREVEPDCDKDTVVKKINSLRTCYRKEFKKVQRSITAGDAEVYKPKLWYYDLLMFLNDSSALSSDSVFYMDEEATNDVSTQLHYAFIVKEKLRRFLEGSVIR
jgi:hypothetical protein